MYQFIVVFANLLENAVEACGRMAGDKKFIRLNSSLEYGVLTTTIFRSSLYCKL